MDIQTFRLGELQTNCYLAVTEDRQAIIIDPADEANFISERIIAQNIKPAAIVATHGHFDHIMAAWELQLAFNIPFFINKKDEKILKSMQKSAQYWLRRRIIEKPPEKISYLKNKIAFGKQKFEIISCPGHTPGGICLYNEKEKIVFTGDTLFADGIGRTDFLYSNKNALSKSIEKLKKLPSETTIYPGHGEIGFLSQALKNATNY